MSGAWASAIYDLVPLIIGFALGQMANLVRYARRPLLTFESISEFGILDQTHEEVSGQLAQVASYGFMLRHERGRMATGIRLFIEQIESGNAESSLSILSTEMREILGIPTDVLPHGSTITVEAGIWREDTMVLLPAVGRVNELYEGTALGDRHYRFHVVAVDAEGGTFRAKIDFRTPM